MIKSKPDTFCNPVNISYQYQAGYYSRESADPCIIVYKNEYYLFASSGTGYWWSEDMLRWNFVYSRIPEIKNFAPAVCVIDDTLYLTSNEGGIYKTTSPKEDDWTYLGKPIHWLDPAFLVDDDGKVYCYHGCSNIEPIYVTRLDPVNNMAVIGEPIPLFNSNKSAHGFEVGGDYNERTEWDCWLEGPWATKYDGKYYLQYAAPGSEFATYADGCYISDNPTGPFTYCENSPISYKPTGFVRGAGHGGTFQDLQGNWWRIDTTNISINHKFERRVIIYRAKFENDRLYTNLAFADYPMYGPSTGSFEDSRPDWNLLTLNTPAKASSSLNGHKPENAFNEDFRTWWSAETGNAGEWLETDLGNVCKMNALQINFADQDAINCTSGRDNAYRYRYLIECSTDGEQWTALIDKTCASAAPFTAQDTSHEYFEFETAVDVRYIRITNHGAVPAEGKFAVSGLRLFGKGNTEPPEAVKNLVAVRSASDDRVGTLTWQASKGARAYLVRFGTRKDALHNVCQVFGKEKLVLRCLNAGVDYFFTIDAYNAGGVTKGVQCTPL